jgi:hypothetical protein
MSPLSVGVPGCVKSNFTPRRKAQSSSALEMNCVPWATVIDSGVPVLAMIRSRAATTSRPPNPDRGSINGLLATKLIDHPEHAEGPQIEQLIVGKIHSTARSRVCACTDRIVSATNRAAL